MFLIEKERFFTIVQNDKAMVLIYHYRSEWHNVILSGTKNLKFLIEKLGDNMTSVGYLLFVFATILIFNSDRQFKKGKIADVKTLFKVKLVGTALLIVSVVFMILGNK